VTGRPRYLLVLEPSPGGDSAPPIIRLRRLLKAALRVYSLRCVEARELPAPGAYNGATPPDSHPGTPHAD